MFIIIKKTDLNAMYEVSNEIQSDLTLNGEMGGVSEGYQIIC